MTKINVLTVQALFTFSDQIWTEKLKTMLEKQSFIQSVYTAQEKNEVLNIVQDNIIDVVLLDINYDTNILDNINFIFELKHQLNIKVIVLTAVQDELFIIYSFMAGASNYVLKHQSKEMLVNLRNLYNKNSPMEVLLNDYRTTKRELTLNALSPSEKEIFFYIQKGYSRSQISRKLNKSESTVKNQIKSVCKKLGTCRKKEAIKKYWFPFL